MNITPKYIVDTKGRKKAVVIDIKTYRRLLAHIENIEDALELDRSVQEAEPSRPYEEVRRSIEHKLPRKNSPQAWLKLVGTLTEEEGHAIEQFVDEARRNDLKLQEPES